jgi:predicted  nucleic acid-binding Zn-ribbon protein
MEQRKSLVRGQGAMKRTCIDCGAMYEPSGVRQQRCGSCGVKHNQKKNRQYQRDFRAHHRTKADAERIERCTWRLEGAKSRAESLHADSMSPSAIAQKLGRSHHTVLKHLARPQLEGACTF